MTKDIGRPQQPARVLLDLLAAAELPFVRFRFDDALVTDADGNVEDFFLGHRQRGIHEHAEQAELRRKEFAGAAAAPFDEELDWVAVSNQATDVRVDYRRGETVAFERTADEKRAGSSEHRAEGEEGEIVPRGDERKLHVLVVEDVRNDEVV